MAQEPSQNPLTAADPSPTRQQIISAQTFLKGLEYRLGNTGPQGDGIDGVSGQATADAITLFKSRYAVRTGDNSLGNGPELTPGTLRALEAAHALDSYFYINQSYLPYGGGVVELTPARKEAFALFTAGDVNLTTARGYFTGQIAPYMAPAQDGRNMSTSASQRAVQSRGAQQLINPEPLSLSDPVIDRQLRELGLSASLAGITHEGDTGVATPASTRNMPATRPTRTPDF